MKIDTAAPARRARLLLAAAALAALAACQKPAEPPVAVKPAATETPVAAAEPGCPDDGPRFPISKLCVGRSINYLDPEKKLITEALDGCSWTMQETSFPAPDGEQVLLFRALSCKGATTQLEFHGGAHSAALGYVASALYPDAVKNSVEPVRIFGSPDQDPKAAIEALKAGIADKTERASCVLEPAGINLWPADALVIRPNAKARAKAPKDEPLAACGEFGVDEDSQTFWRIFQGYAWFFSMGQDTMDFDPASFTLMRKGADGSWGQVP
jgi:hypothetical protein